MSTLKLPIEALKSNINLDGMDFSAKSEVTDPILGHSRAQSALAFGIAMERPGYNIFVMGEPGLGRLSMITSHLHAEAKLLPAPPSYAYVDNFSNPREPIVVELPAEWGQQFSKDIERLIDNLLATFPAAFESPSYQQKKSAIERHYHQLYNNAIDVVEFEAQAMNIALFRDGDSVSFSPIKDNKAVDEEEFIHSPLPERELFHKHVEVLEEYLSDALLELPQWRREMVEKIRQLDNETINFAIEPLFAELYEIYQSVNDVTAFISAIQKNLVNTVTDYLMPGKAMEPQENTAKRLLLTELYAPNILVDNKQDGGVPVIYEPHPIYPNLFGRIEYVSDQGTLVTNYRRICAGSLHKANGGYLILDAEKLLTYPFVWEGLKRALQSGRIEIEAPYSELVGINTITLKPAVIPLHVKIILLGSRDIYYLLEELDAEFSEMFKILADFDDYIVLTETSKQHFIRLMNQYVADTNNQPLTPKAIECLLEHSCRLAENQQHLSAHVKDSMDLIDEANLFVKRERQSSCDRKHIELALSAREQRNGRISQTILEEMLNGTILIDTDDEAIGKINGLTVLEVGDSNFGVPARITVSVHPGSRGIVDIEREVELGQAIHSKGVMILTGYLGHTYAQQFPLAISASIAIEQSYGYIDGDSAALAELCCLISALTRTPIKQSFAVTGSINQYGEVQAVGGINEKIEGFFRLCQARGLTGEHAVIIPVANRRNLMLKQEIIDAVAANQFAVYSVSNVDDALGLLTGQVVGTINREGLYPEHSINFKAISRLKEISEMASEEGDKEEG